MKENEARQQEYLTLLAEIRGFNETTSAQASQLMQTWDDHKSRFEQIDDGLIQAFSSLTDQVTQYVQATSKITNDLDNSFGSINLSLRGFVEEFREALEEQQDANQETRDTN